MLKLAGVLAIFQMVLLMLFFNSRKNRNSSNKILSLILLVYSMQICSIVFMSVFPQDFLEHYNLFPAVCNQFALLFGPLLFFYSKAIINIQLKRWDLLHFAPFVMMILYMTVREILDPGYLFWFSPFRLYSSGLILVHGLIYILITLVGIARKASIYREYISQTRDLKILYGLLLVGFISLWVLKFNTFLFMDIWRRYKLCPFTMSLYFIAGFLFFNILVYFALIKPELFNWKKKYRNTNIAQGKRQQIIDELKRLLEIEKVYSDSSVTLTVLANRAGISVPYLSQIINEEFKVSFSDFINSYRIKEAETLLSETHHKFTIQQIMYDVGFNSKSAFNNAFRKYCGCTPTELKERVLSN
ncbi:MAG: AraC family transcriptional regulator [Bacteroidetes bacterium]|nr:AraC family transcriptional regulator [Bacteroidota bacterium]